MTHEAKTATEMASPGDTVQTFADGSVVIVKTVTGSASLYGAIAKAQADCKGVEKTSSNDHHRYKYASAEAVIEASTDAMAPHGLALICTHITPDENSKMLTVGYVMTHNSGESMALGPYTISVHPAAGRPLDKAISTAATYLQAYALRGILNIPRVEEGTERDSMDDQLIQGYKSAEAELKQKVERSYGALWTSSQVFFDAAKIERARSREGGALFKKWIAFMAHPAKPYPTNMNEQNVAIELAREKLKEWKREQKNSGEDAAQVCAEFAGSLAATGGEEIKF